MQNNSDLFDNNHVHNEHVCVQKGQGLQTGNGDVFIRVTKTPNKQIGLKQRNHWMMLLPFR